MKAFLAACVVAIAVAYGASMVLNEEFQTNAADAFATEGVRLSN
jgi:hypothetical protein